MPENPLNVSLWIKLLYLIVYICDKLDNIIMHQIPSIVPSNRAKISQNMAGIGTMLVTQGWYCRGCGTCLFIVNFHPDQIHYVPLSQPHVEFEDWKKKNQHDDSSHWIEYWYNYEKSDIKYHFKIEIYLYITKTPPKELRSFFYAETHCHK